MSSSEQTDRVIDVEVQASHSQKTGNGSTSSEEASSGSEGTVGDDIVQELGRLGNRVVDLIKTAWASDERKRLEADLQAGLSSMASNLEEGMKKMGEREETQEFIGKAEEVAETVTQKVRSSPVAHNLADNLVKGLRTVGEQIENLSQELHAQTTAKAEAKTEDETKSEVEEDIPVRKGE